MRRLWRVGEVGRHMERSTRVPDLANERVPERRKDAGELGLLMRDWTVSPMYAVYVSIGAGLQRESIRAKRKTAHGCSMTMIQ